MTTSCILRGRICWIFLVIPSRPLPLSTSPTSRPWIPWSGVERLHSACLKALPSWDCRETLLCSFTGPRNVALCPTIKTCYCHLDRRPGQVAATVTSPTVKCNNNNLKLPSIKEASIEIIFWSIILPKRPPRYGALCLARYKQFLAPNVTKGVLLVNSARVKKKSIAYGISPNFLIINWLFKYKPITYGLIHGVSIEI